MTTPRMAHSAGLDFVPARRPEAFKMDVSGYKVIEPDSSEVNQTSEDSETSQSKLEEDDSEDDASFDGSALEDDSSESESDSSPEESEASLGESDQETPGTHDEASDKVKDSVKHDTNSEFYDIGENYADRGSKLEKRIQKSWPPSARAPVGLENQGVTCYQNAAVQSILHLPAVGQYLLEILQGKHPKVSKSSVTYDLAQLFKKLTERKSAVFPKVLIRRLEDINPMLSEWQQEDAHEYYMSLLGRLQEDSTPKGEKLRSSIIHDIFGGTVEQKVTCQRCHTVSTTVQDFYDLPVSFSPHQHKKHHSLEQSIKDFFTPEMIAPTEQSKGYHCEKCKKNTKAVKQIAIDEAPEYLTVHIKRFKFEEHSSKKVKDPMSYPLQMDLSHFEIPGRDRLRYKLIAVIVHEGRTVSSGHYIAIVRQPGNDWVMYDDDVLTKVKESFVEQQDSAYILIYSRLLPKQKKSKQAKQAKPAKESKPAKPAKNELTVEASKPKSVKDKNKTKQSAHVSAVQINTDKRGGAQKLSIKGTSPTKKPKEVSASEKRLSGETIDEIFGNNKRPKMT